MKVILSRKGFDSGSGGMPSPILPDGTLLSMPIPSNDKTKYKDLYYQGKSYLDILKELNGNFSHKTCHLDPDIRKDITSRDNKWIAAFGQANAALTHLNNHNVKEGDIFLFYGWFKQTEYYNGKLRFVKNAPDLHIIYGYMQVGKILSKWNEIRNIYWHPHADNKRKDSNLNAIYLASEYLLDTKLPGYGLFSYSNDLVLTKLGESRSHWNLPNCLVGKNISYHTSSNYKDGYFQSAMRGQEFVIEADKEIIKWIKRIIKK